MRSGGEYLKHGYLRNAGLSAIYWSSVSMDIDYAFAFVFHLSAVTPIYGPNGRHFGFSLCCLQE